MCFADESLLIGTESYKGDNITGLNPPPQQLYIQVSSCFPVIQAQEPDINCQVPHLQAYHLLQPVSSTGTVLERGRRAGSVPYFPSFFSAICVLKADTFSTQSLHLQEVSDPTARTLQRTY